MYDPVCFLTDIDRRTMPGHEKDFLRERGVVTEEQVTLGKLDRLLDVYIQHAI